MCGGGGRSSSNREAEEAAQRRHEEQMQLQRDSLQQQQDQFEEQLRVQQEQYEDQLAQIKATTGGGGAPAANPIAQVAPPPAAVQARMPNATADPLYNTSAAAPESLAIAPRRLQAGSGRRRFRNPVNVAGGAGGLNIPA